MGRSMRMTGLVPTRRRVRTARLRMMKTMQSPRLTVTVDGDGVFIPGRRSASPNLTSATAMVPSVPPTPPGRYNFEICHLPGRLNGRADALSRCPGYDQGENDNKDVVVLPDRV